MISLEELGDRICIIGPSSSGKSTLAHSLAKKLNLSLCYLDQMAHIPHTQWKPKDKEVLKKDHDNFIEEHSQWIIEGNYSFLMKTRFAEATSIIWLDFKVWGSLIRYIKRTLTNDGARYGNLEGAKKRLNFEHIHRMLFITPKKRSTYRTLIEQSDKKLVRIESFRTLKKYYKA